MATCYVLSQIRWTLIRGTYGLMSLPLSKRTLLFKMFRAAILMSKEPETCKAQCNSTRAIYWKGGIKIGACMSESGSRTSI